MGKKGQVWIETVLYTLIGLALMGMVLAFALPKINESKDAAIINQAMESLNAIDNKISMVSSVPGNKGFADVLIKKGELIVNAKESPADGTNGESENNITFYIDGLRKLYSEDKVHIKSGRIDVYSEKGQKTNSVTLTLSFSPEKIDLRYDYSLTEKNLQESNTEKKFTLSPTPHRLIIENMGRADIDVDPLRRLIINIRESVD